MDEYLREALLIWKQELAEEKTRLDTRYESDKKKVGILNSKIKIAEAAKNNIRTKKIDDYFENIIIPFEREISESEAKLEREAENYKSELNNLIALIERVDRNLKVSQ